MRLLKPNRSLLVPSRRHFLKVAAKLIAAPAIIRADAAWAQVGQMPGWPPNKPTIGSGFPSSQQSSDFLARMVAAGVTLTGPRQVLYDTMITGLVIDLGGNTSLSAWPLLDSLWILAAPSSTAAFLNLVGTSSTVGGPTITVGAAGGTLTTDVGYAGNGSSSFLDTNFNLLSSPVHMNLGFASHGCIIQTNRTTPNSTVPYGATDFNQWVYLLPLEGSTLVNWEVLWNTFTPAATNTLATTKAAFALSRLSQVGGSNGYMNGSLALGNWSGDNSSQGAITINRTVWIGGQNNAGSISSPSTDQMSSMFLGGGLTSAQAFAVNNRINTFLGGLPTPVNVY